MITIEEIDDYTIRLYKDGKLWEIISFESHEHAREFVDQFIKGNIICNA